MFTTQPTVALVTPEQKTIIKEDSYMRIHRRLSHAWFVAMGIERNEENETLFAKEDPENWAENANIAPRIDGAEQNLKAATDISDDAMKDQKEELKDQDKQEKADEKAKKKEEKAAEAKAINGASSKAEVIAALEAQGKKAGVDFDPDASRNALLSVYKGA